MKKIVFGGGCFWGVEAYFSNINGVVSTKVGYANGNDERYKNPSYETICMLNTGFVEACYVEYDEGIITLRELLKAFWKIIDPTTLNRQGHDVGSQYRTGIYYIDDEDLNVILNSKDEEQSRYLKTIVTEIAPLINFYDAEEYHQKYLRKNPGGYCHIPRELLKQ